MKPIEKMHTRSVPALPIPTSGRSLATASGQSLPEHGDVTTSLSDAGESEVRGGTPELGGSSGRHESTNCLQASTRRVRHTPRRSFRRHSRFRGGLLPSCPLGRSIPAALESQLPSRQADSGTARFHSRPGSSLSIVPPKQPTHHASRPGCTRGVFPSAASRAIALQNRDSNGAARQSRGTHPHYIKGPINPRSKNVSISPGVTPPSIGSRKTPAGVNCAFLVLDTSVISF